jgi:hypothetical protein
VQTAAGTQGSSPLAAGAPALVQCEPHQEAVLQRAFVNGRDVAQVICVTRQSLQPMPYGAAPYGSPLGYTQAVAYGQPDIVERPVVRTQTVRRRVVRETAPKRSWQKTALVIGGSAGAGAGVGAIAGGKKGALIGAAIGGGAASIFEAFKRR